MNASGIQTITLTDAKNAALTGLKISGFLVSKERIDIYENF